MEQNWEWFALRRFGAIADLRCFLERDIFILRDAVFWGKSGKIEENNVCVEWTKGGVFPLHFLMRRLWTELCLSFASGWSGLVSTNSRCLFPLNRSALKKTGRNSFLRQNRTIADQRPANKDWPPAFDTAKQKRILYPQFLFPTPFVPSQQPYNP